VLKDSLARSASYILLGIYGLMSLLVMYEHVQGDQGARYWLFLALSLLLVPVLIMADVRETITGSKFLLPILLAICLIVKWLYVYHNPTVPKTDYLTFYKTAQALSESWTISSKYVALFPHILGYSSFLSVFFALFGDGSLVAPAVNVVLSVVSMLFIYLISKRLLNRQAATLASMLWIVYPSQTIYNTMVLSEPLYTTLILGFWLWMLRLFEPDASEKSIGRWIAHALAASVLLAMIQAVRPLAWVLFLALAIWSFIRMDWSKSSDRLRKLLFLLTLAVGLWTLGHGIEWYQDSRLGERAARSVGYNIYVGFNEESRGKWNQADSDHLFAYVNEHPDWTADDVQRQMLQDAKDRILQGDINFISLFYDKLHLFWGDDAMAFRYSDLPKDDQDIPLASNVVYFFTFIYAAVGLIALVRKDHGTSALMLALFVLGLTAAHMLTEVAYRYHYSGTAVFAVLAGVGCSVTANIWMRKVREFGRFRSKLK